MKIEALFFEMYRYYSGDAHKLQHLIKVHSFARQIGTLEGLSAQALQTLELAAVVHDIGIKNAVEKHGSGAGHLQELEGPPEARVMLAGLGVAPEVTERVCWLVGHHHSYENIDGMDHQILVEADFLVNMHEGKMEKAQMQPILDKIFKTGAGRRICRMMFAL